MLATRPGLKLYRPVLNYSLYRDFADLSRNCANFNQFVVVAKSPSIFSQCLPRRNATAVRIIQSVVIGIIVVRHRSMPRVSADGNRSGRGPSRIDSRKRLEDCCRCSVGCYCRSHPTQREWVPTRARTRRQCETRSGAQHLPNQPLQGLTPAH